MFIGEERSSRAKENNWTWKDGRLAAKQLFDALQEIGIDPGEQEYLNLFEAGFENPNNLQVVGMGKRVNQKLTDDSIPHLEIIHPAARGRIRRKEIYSAHIKNVLKHKL